MFVTVLDTGLITTTSSRSRPPLTHHGSRELVSMMSGLTLFAAQNEVASELSNLAEVDVVVYCSHRRIDSSTERKR